MAINEKSRLKDSDEILQSLGKHRRIPADGEDIQEELPEQEGSSRRRRRPPRSQEELEERLEQVDHNPLDFGKYQLPKPGRRRKKQEEPKRPPMGPEQLPQEDKVDPFVLMEDEDTRNQFMSEISNRFEQQFSQRFAEPPQKPAREVIDRVAQKLGIRPKGGEEQESEQEQEELPELPDPPAKEQAEAGAQEEAEEQPKAGKRKVIRPVVVEPEEDEDGIREFKLEEFGDGSRAEGQEPENFFQQFVQEARAEEKEQVEDFKETLAEKFMRERERYLEELGIASEMEQELERQVVEEVVAAQQEPEEQPARTRRRLLDFKIRPEMHRKQDEEADAPAPVTYGRNGAVRSLDDVEEELEADDLSYLSERYPPISRMQQPEPEPERKKSAEELLMDLAAHNNMKAIMQMKQSVAPPPPSPMQQAVSSLMMEEPEPEPEAKGIRAFVRNLNVPGKTALISAAAVFLVLALALFPLSLWMSRQEAAAGEVNPGNGVEALSGETLDVYETRRFETRGEYGNVRVHKSGITLENLTVDKNLIIEGIPSTGSIVLSDVTVNGSILLRDSAVDTLELDNVQAREVVVSNEEATVTLLLRGETDLQQLELRTQANVEQQTEEPRVDTTLVRSQDERALDVTFTGAALKNLNLEGDTAIQLVDTLVDTMVADGSLSLEGSGKVRNLSASQWEDRTLVLTLRGVPVNNLYLKSPANVHVAVPVDRASTSDHLNLAGNGSIGNLDINEKFGNARLAVDISGLNISTLVSNTESTVNSAGTSQVNTLTANNSVYLLGHKVNHLEVNADGVIYQNKPDRITVAEGISPPQTVEDNPNIDYSLSRSENTGPTDVSGDDVATTCNDPRESGGYVRGDGSANNPFEVETAAQLAHVSSHLNAHFIQMADIDLTDDSQFASGFTPIGGDTPFSGVYDGNGFSIKNLRISTTASNVGLFASNVGTVKNVSVVSGEITATGGGSVFVGGIVGFNYQDGLVEACSNGALVNGSSSAYAGGITGYNYGGRVRNSYNYAKVSGDGTIGGLVGVNLGDATVVSCYNVGTIDGAGTVGAVAGSNDSSAITNCYYLAETAESAIGSGSGTAVEISSADLQNDQIIVDLSVGAQDSPWIRGSGGYDYPMLKAPMTVRSSDDGASSTASTSPAASTGGSGEGESSQEDDGPQDDEMIDE